MTEQHPQSSPSAAGSAQEYTRCPSCEAIYLINPAKLEVRKGEVRCGECRAVFNAIVHAVERRPGGVFLSKKVDVEDGGRLDQAGEEAQNVAGADSTNEEEDSSISTNLFVDDAQHEAHSSTTRETPKLDIPGDIPETPPDGFNQIGSDLSEDDSVGIQRPVLDIDAPASNDDDSQTSRLFTEAEFSRHDTQEYEGEGPTAQAHDYISNTPEGAHQAPLFQQGWRETSTDDAKGNSINMLGVDEYIVDRPNPLMGFFWFLVCVAFVVLLGLQVKYFFVETFSQNDQYRPSLTLFCKVAGCELPPRRDPYRFAITNTRIDLHPLEPGALRVTIMLVNQAEFHQPYPRIQITLTDRVGRVVGRRTFDSDFYLPRGQENLLESGELGALEFDLARPHEKAVGFVVDVVTD